MHLFCRSAPLIRAQVRFILILNYPYPYPYPALSVSLSLSNAQVRIVGRGRGVIAAIGRAAGSPSRDRAAESLSVDSGCHANVLNAASRRCPEEALFHPQTVSPFQGGAGAGCAR